MGAAGQAPGARSKAPPPFQLRRQKAVPRGIWHFVIELPSRTPNKGHLAVPHGHASEAAWRSDPCKQYLCGATGRMGGISQHPRGPLEPGSSGGGLEDSGSATIPSGALVLVGRWAVLPPGSGGPTSSKAAGQAHSRPDEEFGLRLGFQKRFVPQGVYWRRYLFLTSPASRRAHRCSNTKSCWFH